MAGTNFFTKGTNADGNTEYVALTDSNGYPVLSHGATVPTTGNYAKGCLFTKTDAASGTKGLYENQGDTTTPSFNLIGDITSAEIANDAITTAKILDANVTDAKIAAPKLSKLTGSFVLADMTDGGTTAATYELGTIPLGAVVTRTLVTGITGFIGDTTAVITIGDGSTTDRYLTGTPSVFTTIAALDVGVVSGTIYHSAEKTVTVTITASSEWGDVTAGAATVTIFYYTAS